MIDLSWVDTPLETFLATLAIIGLIGGAWEVIRKLILPAFNLSNRVSELDRRSVKDYKRLDEIERATNAMCKALVAILLHLEETNHTGDMKEAREELTNYLIER
jgi:hypothetical protein